MNMDSASGHMCPEDSIRHSPFSEAALLKLCRWKSDHPERGSATNTTIIMALCRSQHDITSNPHLEGAGEAFGSCGSAKWSLCAVHICHNCSV